MGALADKIAAARRASDRQYKQAIWTLLLGFGAALRDQSEHAIGVVDYYSGNVDVDPELTTETARRILLHGIDFDATTDPATSQDSQFTDTEDSTGLQIDALVGFLVTSDGTRVRWGARLAKGTNFGALIRLLGTDVTIDDALAELEDRIERGDWFTEISA